MNTMTLQKAIIKLPYSFLLMEKSLTVLYRCNNYRQVYELLCSIGKKLFDSIMKFNFYKPNHATSFMYSRSISAVEVFSTINQLNSTELKLNL